MYDIAKSILAMVYFVTSPPQKQGHDEKATSIADNLYKAALFTSFLICPDKTFAQISQPFPGGFIAIFSTLGKI